MGRARPLPEVYRRFGESAGPLHGPIAVALSASSPAMQAVGTAPLRGRHPRQVLAALHHLALAGLAPALAAAYASGDAAAAAAAAVSTLLQETDAVLALATGRRARPDETGRAAVLHPAVAEAARRTGAAAVGLVDVGCSAGLNLTVDRVGISYHDGRRLGDPSSPVQVSCRVVGGRPVPLRPMPEVVVRVGLDADPLDVTDPDDVRWLRACLPPDQPERTATLDAELLLATSTPRLLLTGDLVDLLPEALSAVPADALPVVTTTWALSRLTPARRQDVVRALGDAGRPVAWVSAEGVGVAPSVPTLGDRPASGHSILGLALLGGTATRAEVLGRCWSRGRVLAWLAEDQDGDSGGGQAGGGAGGQAGSSSVA